MIIAGTGGLGLEILGILINNDYKKEIVFYDENPAAAEMIFGKYKVIKDVPQLVNYIKEKNTAFITGVGNPRIREKLSQKIIKLGGNNSVVISKLSGLYQFNNYPAGTIIHPFVAISHHLNIGEGCAIHAHSSIGHAAKIGKYVNIAPGVAVIGPVEIGDYTYISAGAIIMPHIRVGNNVVIGPGVIVKKDVEDFATM